MALLTPEVKKLLNDFSKSQPALNLPGLPADKSGIKLGDLIEAAAAGEVAGEAAAIAALQAAVLALQGAVTALQSDVSDLETAVADHEARITALEP
jgi:S1-C subfamily serine protease